MKKSPSSVKQKNKALSSHENACPVGFLRGFLLKDQWNNNECGRYLGWNNFTQRTQRFFAKNAEKVMFLCVLRVFPWRALCDTATLMKEEAK